MKKLFILLLPLITVSAMAQKSSGLDDDLYQGSRHKSVVVDTKTKIRNISAGDYLKSAASNRLASTLSGVAGGFLIGVSPTLVDKKTQDVATIGGIAFGIISIFTHFVAIDREYKAGVQLNKERAIKGDQALVVKPANEGLGLNITF